MNNIIGKVKESSCLVDFKDPFNKGSIVRIFINIHKAMFVPHDVQFLANIEFKNGNTEGNQRIKGTDFNDLMAQVQSFIDNLK